MSDHFVSSLRASDSALYFHWLSRPSLANQNTELPHFPKPRPSFRTLKLNLFEILATMHCLEKTSFNINCCLLSYFCKNSLTPILNLLRLCVLVPMITNSLYLNQIIKIFCWMSPKFIGIIFWRPGQLKTHFGTPAKDGLCGLFYLALHWAAIQCS